MNEKPKGFWTQHRRLPGSFFGWIILVALLTAAISALGIFIIDGKIEGVVVGCATVVGVGTTLLIGLVFWLQRWRNMKRFLFGVACLITLLALVVTEENWRGKHAWENFKRKYEATGEKFTVTELAPPPVPDDQNFAMTPLLKPALDFFHTTNGTEWRDTNAYARLKDLHLLADGAPSKVGHALGSVTDGTLTELDILQEYFRGNTNYPQPITPGTAAADVLVALGKFDPALAELREATVQRPYSRFPIEYEYQPAVAILIPHLAVIKSIAIVVHAQAVALLDDGQSQRAFEDLKLGFRLSDSIKDEPILISHLVRIATLSMDLQIIQEGLVRHAWNDAQLAEIEKYLGSLNLLAELKNAMRGERTLGVDSLNYLRKRGSVNADDWVGGSLPVRKALSVLLSGFYYQNMLAVAKLHQQYTLPSIDEKAHRVYPDIANAFESKINEITAPAFHPYSIFVGMLLPAISSAESKSARGQTFVDEARIACVLERFRMANENFPEMLAALSPQFISGIPNDVINSQPLHYQITANGYLLYSVGWNQTDDGGQPGWTSEKEKAIDPKNGDWVWRYPAK